MEGMDAWVEKLHASADLHYALGSVHPQVAEFRARYFKGDPVAFQRTYFEQLAAAAETGLYDALSHPDLVKNDFPRRIDRVIDYFGGDGRPTTATDAPRPGAHPRRRRGRQRRRESRAATKAAEKTKTTAE